MNLDVFAAVFAALFAAHQVADHWLQTDYQARNKARPGWAGRWACAAHVTVYTLAAVAALALLAWRAGLDITTYRTGLGLLLSAVTHYAADRRVMLLALASATGKGKLAELGAPRAGHDDNPCLGTGLYALDQSWHYAWLFAAALIIA